MRKALVSFGTGPAAKTLAVALSTFKDYAERHGYDLLTDIPEPCGRPPSWWKVPLLRELLRSYDFVFWIDADAIILDASLDVESVVPADAFQAFVVTDIPDAGSTPCLGVWALRAGDRTNRWLDALWEQEDLIEHRFWEQAAAMRLTGWTLDSPWSKASPSQWDDGTFWLPHEWDVIPNHSGYGPARIRHYVQQTASRRAFDMGTDLARLERNWPRYWLGALERHSRHLYRPAFTHLRAVAGTA